MIKQGVYNVLKIINAVCGVYIAAYLMIMYSANDFYPKGSTNIFIAICTLYFMICSSVLLLNSDYIIDKLFGFVMSTVDLSIMYVVAFSVVNTKTIPGLVIGVLIFIIMILVLCKILLSMRLPQVSNLIVLIVVYLVSILGIAYMFTSYIDTSTVTKNIDIYMLFASLRNSYSLPEYVNVKIDDMAHICQFIVCRVFDTLMLGVCINILHNIMTNNGNSNAKKFA